LSSSDRPGLRARIAIGPGLAALVASVAVVAGLGLSGAARSADDAQLLSQGKALFTGGAAPPCGLCHTLKDAGTSGAIGPPLDEIQPDAARVATALRNGIGAMPSYKASLKEEQIQALARYVAKASGGAK
jgi:cytochrome c6